MNLGSSFTAVPGGLANWSFAGNGNYDATNGTVVIEISKATATVSATARVNSRSSGSGVISWVVE